ncbi:uncharacterized protein LOC120416009 isoform X1 [Culex pipiens pallens]|uniref:uncharacterized protein LOC120416009 isoform X1 n=1 Tax=Culex pipiens pallens TaxID=42434 RepID=UPI0019531E33|nr:uncharacterized protein LOC120416009 isoform X1 [Culex pipiens pallens]
MQSFLSFVTVAVALVVVCKADYNDSQKETINKYSDICKKELDFPEDSKILQMAMYGDLSLNDDKSKQFYACMLMKMGFVEQDGTINGQEIVEFMAPQFDREAVASAVETCKNPEGELVNDKIYAFGQCFFTKKTFEI